MEAKWAVWFSVIPEGSLVSFRQKHTVTTGGPEVQNTFTKSEPENKFTFYKNFFTFHQIETLPVLKQSYTEDIEKFDTASRSPECNDIWDTFLRKDNEDINRNTPACLWTAQGWRFSRVQGQKIELLCLTMSTVPHIYMLRQIFPTKSKSVLIPYRRSWRIAGCTHRH